ncbi:LysR family transcriptional regulator [Romboutsia sp. 1001216sp1]|uniref:LysR family transcriptional regulator n=1 Tax=unclassified Romboutsia TaxID=2626894 RepID=UPI00189EA528|nr:MULTISPECIES: LysR family transcriptional regulator [unclassified Romboutsia]MDB8789180.1 LysR family transcriptional regulator [Romboutsia sp. 1001216sp1]MDB8802235.1 LysR family transcriptional regulator [Romboutsia sp. 1001216sp1]MDB8813632.1 LysR family transcriptional regulator [Romboutsia sp. 1001216sp1]
MNIRKLEIFYKTAKCLNMSQVAKDMYISQPSISQCISEIESEIDTKLFDRIGKKLYLTHEGKIFYEYTRRILNIYEEGINVVRSSKSNKGKLVIGASTTIGTYIMPYIIHKFNKKEKDIEISMIIDNKHNIEELILNNKVDIAFIEGTVNSKEIILKDIWTDELVFISSINHEWNGKKYLDIEDLKNNKFIIREDGSGTRERFEGFLENNDIKFNSYIELSNLEAILNYVKLNIGVSCVPYMSVLSEENSKSINVYRIKDHKINRSLYSAIHKDKYISKPIECFMKFCEKTDILNNK